MQIKRLCASIDVGAGAMLPISQKYTIGKKKGILSRSLSGRQFSLKRVQVNL
jgi:hypothetical protein